MNKILLVEDDKIIASSIVYYLQNEEFEVDNTGSVTIAEKMIKENKYDLAILDVTLIDGNGYELYERIKKLSDIPCIFLTALDEEINIIHGLELGADDYITKPFRAKELLLRIKSVLRRCKSAGGEINIYNLKINTQKGKVFKDNEPVFLTVLEYKILLILIENKGQVLTRDKILAHIWDISEDYVNDNTLTVYIKRLRDKIEDEPENPKIIKTVRGLGYRLGD